MAQVVEARPGLTVSGRGGTDGFVDDAVKFLHQVGDVGKIAPLLELLVDGLDVVVALGVGKYRRLHQERFETKEDQTGKNLEATFGFIRGVDCFNAIGQRLNAREAFSAAQGGGIEAQGYEV